MLDDDETGRRFQDFSGWVHNWARIEDFAGNDHLARHIAEQREFHRPRWENRSHTGVTEASASAGLALLRGAAQGHSVSVAGAS